jgi:undecaprenyl-diphosphatase
MILNALKEIVEFALIVVLLYFALRGFARWRRGKLNESIGRNRMLTVILLALALMAIKVGEDVLEGESGPMDEATLRYIREHVPPPLERFFRAITLTGSWRCLVPLVIAVSVAFLAMGKRFEALLLSISAVTSTLIVYLIKTAVGRARPSLWETDWYWGSSFPSGHTLQTATVASALVICLARSRYNTARWLAPFAILWIIAVAMSRLVLGVHWPSDVLTAACLGVIIPFVLQSLLERSPVK